VEPYCFAQIQANEHPSGLTYRVSVLVGTSFTWAFIARHNGRLCVPVLSHILADTGIVIAVWIKVQF